MKENKKEPLKIALNGFDGKNYKSMAMFFASYCKGMVTVVDSSESQVDMIDMDSMASKQLFDGRLQKSKSEGKAVIVASVNPINIQGVIFIQKPYKSETVKAALEKAIDELKKDSKANQESVSSSSKIKNMFSRSSGTSSSTPSGFSTTSHKAAMGIDETTVSDFSSEPEVIETNVDKLLKYNYAYKHELQGFIQSAIKHAKGKNQAMKLTYGWKPIVIIPFTNEVWIDVDDRQLKAYLTAHVGEKKAQVAPMNLDDNPLNESKQQPLENFLWKVAIWTAKGRYPIDLDIQKPVYLSRWPNLTRCVMIPHALRIAALLIEGPRTPLEISRTLKIKHEYVFAFISAAYAIGILGQDTKPKVDDGHKPKAMKPEAKGLLGKIMSKLRGN